MSPAAATVLLVEDEAHVRELLRGCLLRDGYQVVEAADGPGALAIAADAGDIALLVTDVTLPGMSGRDLARALRALHPQLPVLFVSGYLEERLEADDLQAGTAFLQKPFPPAALARAVRRLLDDHRNYWTR